MEELTILNIVSQIRYIDGILDCKKGDQGCQWKWLYCKMEFRHIFHVCQLNSNFPTWASEKTATKTFIFTWISDEFLEKTSLEVFAF